MKKEADKIAQLHSKLDDMIELFDFFIVGRWEYDCSNIYNCL